MLKTLIPSLFVATTSTAFAQTSLYYQVENLYDNASVPTTKAINAESMWGGKCVYLYDNSNIPDNGVIFFHVNRDPVVGDTFYMDPVFKTPDAPSYDYERNIVLDDIDCGRIRTPVTLDSNEKAWRTDYQSHDTNDVYFLRQGKTQSGQVAFFLKFVADSGSQRDSGTRAYCYYYQTNPQGGVIVVPPPAN